MSAITDLDFVGGLTAFVAAVDAGGFAAAGRKLGVSASAVGKAVSRLETRYAVRLLERTTRSLALTEEGRVLYARSSGILDDLREAENALSATKSDPAGRVRVSLPTVLGRRVVLPALAGFAARYPDIELDLWLDDRKVEVVGEGFDLVVRLGSLEDSSLIARRIAPHRFTTCCAPSYLEGQEAPRTPSDLAKHRCIVYRFPTSGRLEHWLFKAGESQFSQANNLVLNDGEALAVAACAGLGIAQLPGYLARDDIERGRLVPLLQDETADRGDIWLVWPSGRTDMPRVRVCSDFLRDAILDAS